MSRRVKVTEMLAPYAHEGVSYGPFRATEDRPYLEVPERLANALGLPLHESELRAREEAQAAEESEDLGSLREQLAQVERERDELQFKVKNQAEIIERGTADNQRLTRQAGESNDNSFRLKAELDKAQAGLDSAQQRVAELEAGWETLSGQRDTLAAQLEAAQAQPSLPADARERLVKLPKIGEKLADDVLEALKATPE